jgi:hypothetical protein
MSPAAMASSKQPDIHDVIIIGAGPCGLAVAARLRELAPAAIFTDEEHRRYHWLRKHKLGIAIKHVKGGHVSCTPHDCVPDLDVVVLDAEHADKWLGRWDRLFATYDIQHLRSPLFWHMDPGDRDSLLAFAYETERVPELLEIRHCVGKEISKHTKKTRKSRGGRSERSVQDGAANSIETQIANRLLTDKLRQSRLMSENETTTSTHRGPSLQIIAAP